MLALKEYRNYKEGFHSLLVPTELVRDGLILGKDGCLISGFYLEGLDIASLTPAQRNHIATQLNAAMVGHFGAGWVTSHELVRKPSAQYPDAMLSSFPDAISQLIEDERRVHFQREGRHYESANILMVRYKSQALENPRFQKFLYQGKAKTTISTLENEIAHFKRVLQSFADSLNGILKVQPMRGYTTKDAHGNTQHRDDLINYLNFTYTGEAYPVNLPDYSLPLEAYLGAQDFFPSDIPKIGEQFIACVSLTGMPSDSFPNMLEVLNHLPLVYRWVTRMIYLDPHETVGLLKKRGKEWEQQAKSPVKQVLKINGGWVNQDAVNMTLDTQAVLTEVHSGEMAFGYCTQTIVLMDTNRDQLTENARLVVREIKRLGFACRLETLNTVEAWLGTLPGQVHQNVRRQIIHSQHLTHLVPLTSIWSGHESCPNPLYAENSPPLLHAATTGSTPFRLNLHVGDVGHTLIMGPTGAGKSVLLATIAAQFRRYPNATIAAFDKGYSMWTLVNACGGQHYDIGGEQNALAFAPLSQIDTDQDMAWAEDWIAAIYETRTGKAATPRQHQEIHRAMRLLRETKSPDQRSLTDFLVTLQQCGPDDDLKAALEIYTLKGPYGALLDARQDGLKDSAFSVFEIEELMAMKERIAIPVLLYLFRRFEKSLRSQPALLLLDEAWVMLGHPVFREKIRQWLKELRKKNCAVVMATQSLSDAIQSQIYDVLLESCPTKILLPNEEADKTGTAEHPGPFDLYTMMGLNEAEIQIIRTGTKKRHYYYVSPEGRRLFDLGLGSVALSFVGVSDKKTVTHLQQLKEKYASDWPLEWLKERGIGNEAMG